MAKGGSKVVTGIVAFILGILFAVIITVATLFGVGYYGLNTDIDQLFGWFGQKNDDGNGNQLINTDTDNGGVRTLMELCNEVMDMSQEWGQITMGRMAELSPAFGVFCRDLYVQAEDYGVTIDADEFEAQPFVDLPTYLQEVMMDMRPGLAMRKAGYADMLDQNRIVGTLFEGAEYEYVYAYTFDKDNSPRYPVYYDEYAYDATLGKYFRTAIVDATEVLPDNIGTEWLGSLGTTDDNGNEMYRLYYYAVPYGEGEAAGTYYIVTKKDDGGEYLFNGEVPSDEHNYNLQVNYGEQYQYATGNYYYDNGGNEIQVSPVTLRSLSEDAFGPLYHLPASEMLNNPEDAELVDEVFHETSVGEILNGDVKLNEKIERLSVSSVPGITISVDDSIMMYLAYGVTGLDDGTQLDDGSYVFSGKLGGEDVFVKAEKSESGETYKVVSFHSDSAATEDSVIGVEGTKVKELSDKIDNLTEQLTVGEIIDNVDENDKIIHHLLGYTVDELPEKIDELTIGQIFEEDLADNNVLSKLKDASLGNLSQAIKDLTVQELYSADIYGTNGIYHRADAYFAEYTYYEKLTDGEGNVSYAETSVDAQTDFKNGEYYYTYDGKTLMEVTQENFNADYIYYVYNAEEETYDLVQKPDLPKGKLAAFDEMETYYTYGSAKRIWKLMLCTRTEDMNGIHFSEGIYQINDMGKLVKDTEAHMKTATIDELAEAGIIEEVPNQLIPVEKRVDGNTVTYYVKSISSATLKEVMNSIDYFSETGYAGASISPDKEYEYNGVTYKIVEM